MVKNALIVANLAGFASFLIHDIKLLIEKGYKVTYAANANKLEWSDTERKIKDLDVSFVQIDFNSSNPFALENIRAYRQLKVLLKHTSFNIIHCHTPIAGILTRLAARSYRKNGATVIYTSHGFAFTKSSSRKAWLVFYTLEKICSLFCDAIITINSEDYVNAKKMFCKNVFRINGVGVDTQKYLNVPVQRAMYRDLLGVSDNKIMILAVGELSVRKNHQVIIRAISQIDNKEDYVFVICGNGIDGGTGKMLSDLAEQEKVELRLLGFRMDIPEITAVSDIGVMPSVREGLGLAGIQFLAAGIPVIGTNVQGISDYVIPNKTGILCDAYDVEKYRNAIVKLSDSTLRESMKNNCIEMAKQFDIKISYKQMREIYEYVLN